MFLTEVPFKRNGARVKFFDDHLELKGKKIQYNEIATLTTNCSITIQTFMGIPVGRGFAGIFSFKMNFGKTYKINMNSFSLFGIPIVRNPHKYEKLYPPLFNAVNSIVAKNMAQRHIDAIKIGNTVEVAGLIINSLGVTTKNSKNGFLINKENYRNSQITNGFGVIAYNKSGEKLWSSSIWSYKNVLLIPYILDAIFGSYMGDLKGYTERNFNPFCESFMNNIKN